MALANAYLKYFQCWGASNCHYPSAGLLAICAICAKTFSAADFSVDFLLGDEKTDGTIYLYFPRI
jgi:hypothetical protein